MKITFLNFIAALVFASASSFAQTPTHEPAPWQVVEALINWEEHHQEHIYARTSTAFDFISHSFAANSSCMLSGYIGSRTQNGVCKPIEKDQADFDHCGKTQYPCNEDVFGKNSVGKVRCISRDEATYHWTSTCAAHVLKDALSTNFSEAQKLLASGDLTEGPNGQEAKVNDFLKSRGASLKKLESYVTDMCQPVSALSGADREDCGHFAELLDLKLKNDQSCNPNTVVSPTIRQSLTALKKNVRKQKARKQKEAAQAQPADPTLPASLQKYVNSLNDKCVYFGALGYAKALSPTEKANKKRQEQLSKMPILGKAFAEKEVLPNIGFSQDDVIHSLENIRHAISPTGSLAELKVDDQWLRVKR